jgi:AraC family transcriptional regulator, ethanolamine operon transcriptional activator
MQLGEFSTAAASAYDRYHSISAPPQTGFLRVFLLSQLVASDALTISRSPDFDHFQSIEKLGEARSIPLDCRDFAASFATVTLKSCAIYLQRTFPRILQTQYRTTGAIVAFAMEDASSVILNGVQSRALSVLLAKGRTACEFVEPQANLIAFVNFDSVEDRGWPGEIGQAQLIAAEPAKFEALRAVTRDTFMLASRSPELLSRPGMIESIEESVLQAVDHAVQPAVFEGKAASLGHYLSLVRRFDEFLASNAGRTLYSADVAKQLGVSVRTLHNAVVAIRGMSMHRYTRLRRLWSVRQQLVQGRQIESIKAIALMNGFWHLGEFATLYRDLFGEMPQQTLAARRQPGRLS